MCGSDERISIERVGNGFTIDAYKPSGEGKPGKHHRSVATSSEHVMRAVGKHLGKGKRKGTVVLSDGEGRSKMKAGKKVRAKAAYKRA